MATTDDDVKKGKADYAAAFNEDMPTKAEPSEDEAFGIQPESQPESQPAAVIAVVDTAKGGEPAGETDLEDGGNQASGGTPDAAPREDGDPSKSGIPAEIAKPGVAAVEAKPASTQQPMTVGANGGPATSPSTTPSNDGVPAGSGEKPGAQPAEKPAGDKLPMTEQQLRSWEGRLKKMAADFDAGYKAKGGGANAGDEDGDTPKGAPNAAPIDMLEQVEDKSTNKPMASEAGAMADKIESGDMSPSDAMAQLTEDFGADFVKMIQAISKAEAAQAGSAAAESKVGEVKSTLGDVVNHLNETGKAQHFAAIAAKHPDYKEIGGTADFKDYVANHPSGPEAARIVKSGSAPEVNALIDGFKASKRPADPVTPTPTPAASPAAPDALVNKQMDNAEGVRSSGRSLPQQPKPAGDSYEDAWNSMA